MDKGQQSKSFPIEDRGFSQQAYHMSGNSYIKLTLFMYKSARGDPILSQNCVEGREAGVVEERLSPVDSMVTWCVHILSVHLETN